ncbi:hypothetical protein BDA99DRAFT_528720 [Phascolomyces articulosus]|uniref:Uncharacterized protein n=1 Tax=Phascolomyces articulosus TaxID=60185 RepID=A0AAD5P8U8_9FUNG|nr:hypothetical protein BDA99DRAFT_528720 [Phascolomyces articulosus]
MSTPSLQPDQQQSETVRKTNNTVSWQNELSQFFNGIGLTETSQCLNAELVVLSRHHLERLPIELEKLVDQLLQTLEQHVQAKEDQESTQQRRSDSKNNNEESETQERQRSMNEQDLSSTTLSSLSNTKKRKRQSFNDNNIKGDEKEEQERVKRMDSEQVQIRATHDEIQQRIQTFIQAKQSEVDASNRTEFLSRVDPSSSELTCARADAREINRNIQMKFDIVNNEDGPLARSLMSSNDHVQISTGSATTTMESALEERIQNIEQHLNVSFDDQAIPPFTLHERIKILENTLIDIEREHPKWAAIHFHQPNRKFPPAPPITYIMRPDGTKGEYVTTQRPPQTPPTIPGHPHMKTTGRANSSLTRAVLEQLNRKRQQQVIADSSLHNNNRNNNLTALSSSSASTSSSSI